jgi:5-(carboxyamino)imidazole ribonucleotide synthase
VRIGVLGGGQLGRMLGLAGVPLGLSCRFLDPGRDAPAAVAGELVRGDFDDPAALARLAQDAAVATYEFENVPLAAARAVAELVPLHPGVAALEAPQDRLTEKSFFRGLGIPTAAFAPVSSLQELDRALETIGTPALLKTRRFGYDGKGQARIETADAAPAAFQALGGGELILEAVVPFTRELSILGVRSADGRRITYPLIENRHEGGILRLSIAPAAAAPELARAADGFACRVLDALAYVGVVAIELFEVGGALLVNEMAPRVHNSGHWTMEGAQTSQFENHLRAITGLPLGSPEALGHSAMVNLIGTIPDPAALLALPGAHLHLYGKAPRPGRKLGHVTLRGADAETVRYRGETLLATLSG